MWFRPFWELQKESLSEHDAWLWVALKNFLKVTSMQRVCLQASLGSYLSAKTNGSIVRCFNQILQFQTWAEADFSDFIPPSIVNVNQTILRTSKREFEWTWCLTLSGAQKFSKGHQHATCVFASFLRIISIRRNKREHRTMLQSDFTIPNVSCC